MEVRSKEGTVFTIYETDKIMYNGNMYLLLTQREDGNTYPVLHRQTVENLIHTSLLQVVNNEKTPLTNVKATIYRKQGILH